MNDRLKKGKEKKKKKKREKKEKKERERERETETEREREKKESGFECEHVWLRRLEEYHLMLPLSIKSLDKQD